MIRLHARVAPAVHPLDCGCPGCEPRAGLGDIVGMASAGFAMGAGFALAMAFAAQPAAAASAVLAIVGIGL